MHELVQLLGCGEWFDGYYGSALSFGSPAKPAPQSVLLELLNPVFEVDRERARILSGALNDPLPSTTVVGCGALGSHLCENLARSGAFCRAHYVDKDSLLPHNLVRHTASGGALGRSKAPFLAEALQSCVDHGVEFTAAIADVMTAPKSEWLLDGSEFVLDISASVVVARKLASEMSDLRLGSAFLSPSGQDSVLLLEDQEKNYRLDELEMEYYLLTASETQLDGHLNDGLQVRYGHACRNLSSTIPKASVALNAGILADQLDTRLRSSDATVSVWRSSSSGQVRRFEAEISPWKRISVGAWDVRLRESAFEAAQHERTAALPNETGGVLVGAHDLDRKILYIVDVLSAPSDSTQRPYMFERGNDGLVRAFRELGIKTGGWLKYVGEWHSHPEGSSSEPSEDDWEQFGWLEGNMAADGLPAVQIIVCQSGLVTLVVERTVEITILGNNENGIT